jgi:hypothetical protein
MPGRSALNRVFNRLVVLAAAGFLLGTPLAARAAEKDGASPNVKLTWGLVRRSPDGVSASELPSRKLSMPSGTTFRFYYQAYTPQYLYFFLDDAGGTLSLIRPASPGRSARMEPGAPEYVPGGTAWFTLDANPGTETFYLLVADAPLDRLETLMKEGMGPQGAKGAAREALVAEITALKRTKSALTSPAEKPVPIAGTTRGAAPGAGASLEGLEVNAERFYTRTLRIDHQ